MRAGALYCPAGAEPTHLADAGLKRVSPGGRGRNISFLRIAAILFDGSRAFPARTRAYFSLVGKVGKSTHGRRNPFDGVSPPCPPLPRRHKGGRLPPFGIPRLPYRYLRFLWILPRLRYKKNFSTCTPRNMSPFNRAGGRNIVDHQTAD